jgi:hypothetical protein
VQAALTELLAAHQSGTFVAPSRMPRRDFVEPRLAALENQARKPTTLRGHGMGAYVLPRLGDVALEELRASDLDACYAELLLARSRRRWKCARRSSVPVISVPCPVVRSNLHTPVEPNHCTAPSTLPLALTAGPRHSVPNWPPVAQPAIDEPSRSRRAVPVIRAS